MSPRRKGATFTSREMEVLRLVCRGESNKGIALCLGISHSTVKGHISRMFDRAKVGNRVELVVFALKESLVELSEL